MTYLSDRQIENLEILKNKIKEKDIGFLNLYEIDYSIKDDYWILNYRQFGKRNEINKLCRSLILHQPTGNIVSFPFIRFDDIVKDKLDFTNSNVIEKLDGTLVCVSLIANKYIFHTRRLLSTHDMNFEIKSFNGKIHKPLQEIKKYLDKLDFNISTQAHYTFMFEFINDTSKVITNYKPLQFGLYLIGMRQLDTYYELSEKQLNRAALYLNVKRPRIYNFTSYAEIEETFKNYPDDFEGFIVREKKTGNRVKLKTDTYKRLAKLLSKDSYKNLLDLFLQDKVNEVLEVLPHCEEKLDIIKKNYTNFILDVVYNFYLFQNPYLDNGWDKKKLAKRINHLNKFTQFIIFKRIENKDEAIQPFIKEQLRKLSLDKVMEYLELKDL